MAPRFSIIIGTYGRPQLLAEAIDSVLGQTYPDFECIVVDDCSPLPAAVPTDPRVVLVRRRTNGGLAAALNTGLSLATGAFITFLDDDDLLATNRLELAMEGLRRSPISICWAPYVGETVGNPRVLEGFVHDVILDSTTPPIGAVAVQRDRMCLFDERFRACLDLDWWLRVTRSTPVTTVRDVGYLVRKHAGERHLSGIDARIVYSFKLLEKHREYFRSHTAAAAFRWRRIGIMASRLGDHSLARRSLGRSLVLRPAVRTVWHLVRALRPSSARGGSIPSSAMEAE